MVAANASAAVHIGGEARLLAVAFLATLTRREP